MLEIDSLTRKFGSHIAVNKVSFNLSAGDVVGFLGPNGAGKSTTMRMIAGVLEPNEGDARILGCSITTDRRAAQEKLGYLPEGAPLYDDMTPLEFLGFIARSRGLTRNNCRTAVEQVTADARISSVCNRPIGTLSKGYRRRVGLAAAILHDPPVLVLDEPTDGLDPNQKRAVRALISRMSATKAILISTHTLEEVPAMCNRVIIVDRGRIVADDTPEGLTKQGGSGGLARAFTELTDQTEIEAA